MQILHLILDIMMQLLHNIIRQEVQIMTLLKELRVRKRLTQREAARRIGVSLRSYVSYENDETKANTPKYRFLASELERIEPLDEEHGLLSVEQIREACRTVFAVYDVDCCWLFGSYAKGTAAETSDVDLLVSTRVTGLRFYELTERLRQALCKKVDLLEAAQLLNSEPLLREVLKDGVKIYG